MTTESPPKIQRNAIWGVKEMGQAKLLRGRGHSASEWAAAIGSLCWGAATAQAGRIAAGSIPGRDGRREVSL